jgi:hypothetical protein
MAVGPIVEALVGGAAGAGLGAGVMAGGAAVTQAAVAVHRLGVPDERLAQIEEMLAQGRYMVLLIVGDREADRWRSLAGSTGAEPVWDYPYVSAAEAAKRLSDP